MKLIGAALILLGCGGAGFYLAATHEKELRTLRKLMYILEHMISELQFRMTPLPELCLHLIQETGGVLRNFFQILYEELEQQINPDVKCCVRCALKRCHDLPNHTAECLEQMGASLGRFDLEGQLRALDGVVQLCKRHIAQLEENKKQRLRSYKTLGICAGAAMVILFI